ncbi:hypothetical protein Sgly_0258 [Syntrophobotulus glycolicus DSM 8271]|uniref:Putative zinc ribbon domain-containing protein n=1 Tax=Syntrophobotulus glycolicus (strain DSM 8271 / FlGlyR) TaxID=645991 RepID=F0SWT7_SYNGF|nr:zinc ribbon domain-containing protein [Syntrophobotulus glycolicus]ADY54627.1 hypothetical protein Sgly_0258 [Syntrophobotulus glycolicus DSM 8271]
MKTCIACGMPMKDASEFAAGDLSKDYCVHCARPDGSMQSYTEKLDGFSSFIMKTQGLNKEVADETARNIMKTLPAWQ